ncbi:MAG: transposase [Thermoflexales bacterium]|nr:transposase [Thermoflexales bacterium]
MPSARPGYLAGYYYHIYNRGVASAPLFREDENYVFVLRKVKQYSGELSLAVIAYCLMPNHYHFLLRQDGECPAGLLPQRVFNSYTKAYNKRYERSGTLFEGHYKVIALQEESHLLHLCRYIHANPVKAGLVADAAEWPYSNYLEWVEQRHGTLIDRAFVREHFPIPQRYREFVMDYLASEDV